ncbi:hypothetical protein H072_769 [Dactylellina haptotyla CBS 200.50]|uniref:Thioredoxin-like fold domain-containing protein n=1 Tax=Dactylellina haptotyla (strain CBS 200.50) TaxID=1284197 RepID=S8AQU3_DACHA|nr:hypothetical protein H072_769 [Dactylellina haptotyla CBS 200.50]
MASTSAPLPSPPQSSRTPRASSSSPAAARTQISTDTTARGTSFRPPRFIRVLFDRFPIYIYPTDPVPMTAREFQTTLSKQPKDDIYGTNTLYVFSLPGDAQNCAPSFNPGCLKWQTYLKIRGVGFCIESSSNHASPTGSLPFLIAEAAPIAGSSERHLPKTIPVSKLAQWVEDNAPGSVNQTNPDTPDYRAFTSLIDTSIRQAWLYALYIDSTNFKAQTKPRYTYSTPIWPVNYFLGLQMRQAALDNLKINTEVSKITGRMIYLRAKEAWAALGALLGGQKWFFGAQDAGIFDASVFAYTHLILNQDLEGSGQDLRAGLETHANLVNHERRIRSTWFG